MRERSIAHSPHIGPLVMMVVLTLGAGDVIEKAA
jgi:hypothetical protein